MLRLHFRFKTSIDFSCETCIFSVSFSYENRKKGPRLLSHTTLSHILAQIRRRHSMQSGNPEYASLMSCNINMLRDMGHSIIIVQVQPSSSAAESF
jgi:hypothetical protein